MSFNVLCDKYATQQLYGYCPSWAMNWDYRKSEIIKEIVQYNADILSLQVDFVNHTFIQIKGDSIYQLLHQYHRILAACNIHRERALSQHFAVLMQ